ncbi:GtrA family protein [Peptostreptococcus sp. D1]|uniref:GtrA family protein n=1 Tax=Peptostreptococcus sp. D1 TaxID=72304 RepID=UPI0008EFBC9F|nr:GtrA family protein [Peptostreptococcus sp. D1]SFE21663.1 Putative flippase GtrA (transmembrane translocase of bactoprenol-linked glucose) [Peptostreptococcus sp. D1]
MQKILDILSKNREIINYLVFGVLTTIVNFMVYFFAKEVVNIYYLYANVMAWFISVLFAYATNRVFVFEKVNFGFYPILREIILFFVARLLSGAIETALLFLMVELIRMGSDVSKILVAVVVVVLNYVFSKLIIFKEKKND